MQIDEKLYERMVTLLRDVATVPFMPYPFFEQARDIVAALPSADLIEAREWLKSQWGDKSTALIDSGGMDKDVVIVAYLAGKGAR